MVFGLMCRPQMDMVKDNHQDPDLVQVLQTEIGTS
jgi:hypothetical protein